MITSPGGTKAIQLLTAVSADETYSQWIDVRGYTNLTFYCTSVGTTSSGVLTFEEAAPADMTALNAVVAGEDVGNYSAITTENASAFSGGAQIAVHISAAAYYFVRARISTVIGGGGTISVGMVAA